MAALSTRARPSRLLVRVRALKPCPACAPFNGLWMEREGKLTRCTCLRGELLEKLDARRKPPEEQSI